MQKLAGRNEVQMMPPPKTLAELVLVGAGHANIQVLKNFAMRPVAGLRVTLVSDQPFAPYSGMLPGLLAGWYQFDEAHFDLVKLCDQTNTRFVQARCIGIDAKHRLVHVDGRPSLAYDLAAVNVGIVPRTQQNHEGHLYLKPISQLLGAWESFKRAVANQSSRHQQLRIAVIGGGAAGIEISLIIARILRAQQALGTVTLVECSSKLLSRLGQRAGFIAEQALKRNGIKIRIDSKVEHSTKTSLRLESGEELGPFDHFFWATDATPPDWFRSSELPCDDQGFLAVDQYLRVLDRADIFGAGDCIHFAGKNLPKAGVYAVRQGKILSDNIRASFSGKPLTMYRPQNHALALITLGEKSALASYGRWAIEGKWLWKLKDRIDRRFMERWQTIPMFPRRRATSLAAKFGGGHRINTCGGCGAKVHSQALRRCLDSIQTNSPRQFEDASLIHTQAGHLHLQSLDGLKAFDRDLFLFGRIATVHAISDIYARGGFPTSVQCLVHLEDTPDHILESDLRQIMAGVQFSLNADGIKLAGGHTMLASEAMLGIVADGSVETSRLQSKVGIQAGDVLILTKPLGTGAIFAAQMLGGRSAHWMNEVVPMMGMSSKAARQILNKYSVHASTDVTGFGLFGHLLEMLEGNDKAVEIDNLPAYSSFEDVWRKGIHSSLEAKNFAAVNLHISWIDLPGGMIRSLGCDPQTSGGLLFALPSIEAPNCIHELISAGYSGATIIGKAISQTGMHKIYFRKT